MGNVKVTVIVTVFDQKDLLLVCLEQMKNIHGIENCIIVDMKSTDGTEKVIPDLGYDFIMLDQKDVGGYATAWNAAVNSFNMEDIIVFMEPRYILGETCLMRLAESLEADGIGVAGAVSNGFFYPQNISMSGIKDKEDLSRVEELQLKSDQKPFKTLGISDHIWAVKKAVLKETGLFLEELMSPKSVLLDFELRMMQKGYLAAVCPQAVVYDCFAGETKTHYNHIYEAFDNEILKKVWNMNYFNLSPNGNLASLVDEDKDASFKVLEIGCDLGATLLEIKNRFPNCKTYGLDINEEAVKIAAEITDVKVGNVEEQNLPFEDCFDYIIFGDVLEHLRNPHGVLRYCREKLNDHGHIIASIPNLMHISVMQQLLQGRFQYQDMGLLDRSHVHFFTYYEILAMFIQEKYTIEQVMNIIVNTTEQQELLIEKLLLISENNVDRSMYHSYQYLIKASKGEKD